MPSNDPMESAAKGAVEGVLDWSTEKLPEKLKQLVQKFRDRKIAFVNNPEIIALAKEQRQTSEWALFNSYVQDDRLHILFQMGLTLRQLEKDEKKRNELRLRIMKKYGTEGLHIAQFIQNGFFLKYVDTLQTRTTMTPDQLKTEIAEFFKNLETTCSYIQNRDYVNREAATIVTRIQSHHPRTYIISGSRLATQKCRQVKNTVMRRISGYEEELYRTDIKEVYFLNRKEPQEVRRGP